MGNTKRLSLKNFWEAIGFRFGRQTDVYFISGMCYNCSVFDDIILPKGYNKIYLEWLIPTLDETLEEYSRRIAGAINCKKKFILIGYSLGGIVVQEIARFMNPQKVVLLSTMKVEREIPSLFALAKKMHFADNIPMKLYRTSNFMINLFNRYVYSLPTTALTQYMTVVDPIYLKWALREITNWMPKENNFTFYHIHGTKDQVFPYDQIEDAITVKGGDHLMVVKRAKDITSLLENILKEKVQLDKRT